MEKLFILVKIIAIFLAAIILGSWFSSEVKKSKRKKEPAYKPYLSPPGIIIAAIIILLPIIAWVLKH